MQLSHRICMLTCTSISYYGICLLLLPFMTNAQNTNDEFSENLIKRNLAQWGEEAEIQQSLRNGLLKIKSNKHLILGEIAKGGTSTVYQVLDITNLRVKAVKQIALNPWISLGKKQLLNEKKFLERLKGEGDVIYLSDSHQTADVLQLVLEYAPASLFDYFKQKSELTAPFIRYICRNILKAVKAIHNHGILHLDLKPNNMVFVNGTLKLIDFGSAASLEEVNNSTAAGMAGTIDYMSPEVAIKASRYLNWQASVTSNTSAQEIGPHSDVWSFGCVLYQLMYGKTHFQRYLPEYLHWSEEKYIEAIPNPEYKIIFDNYPDKDLLEIVQLCLQRDATKRPTVKQLIDRFNSYTASDNYKEEL